VVTTAWFVDGGYALRASNSVSSAGARMDYSLLCAKIEDDAGEKIGDTKYFNCDTDPPNVPRMVTTTSCGLGRVARACASSCTACRQRTMNGRAVQGGAIVHPVSGEQYIAKMQKAVGVGLAFHLMRSSSKVGRDKLYLPAGDGDFHESCSAPRRERGHACNSHRSP
jgi:hypothetical protein